MTLEDLKKDLTQIQENKKKIEATYLQIIGQEALLIDMIKKEETKEEKPEETK